MTDRKIDFSSLEPFTDRGRLEDIARTMAARVVAVRRRRPDLLLQLLAWSRPALAIAACVALVSWVGPYLRERSTQAQVTSRAEPAFVLAGWSIVDHRPSTKEILQVLGDNHGNP